ncbi:MAG TPA: cyclopropane-fatty-acyl-phospholipid synthase family protein [Acidimicrobiales bacterium]|nr:cyclopropane-fatty-acyl-phospholipid synthase family protein [Acidimicrobiales bacterium]
MAPQSGGVATSLQPLIRKLIGNPPVRLEFWDGSALGSTDAKGTIRVITPNALRRIIWAPNELGPGRAYVAGELDVDGDIFTLIDVLKPAGLHLQSTLGTIPTGVAAAARVGALGLPPSPPPEEARPRGRRHSKRRDRSAISHHYDVGNEFYELVLGPSMTYSCARWTEPDMNLVEAQASKHDVICRKLGLPERRGARMLDVGCGWGSLALHAAQTYDAHVVGVTISEEQAAYARRRVEAAGLSESIEIRLQDYRDVRGEFDVISSVGMFEHVGAERMADYFAGLRALLGDHGRLLNHAISSIGGSRISRNSFVGRYVFPDGELIDVGRVVLAMEAAGFEVRDVESLREHYALTLRAWVANLEASWSRAVELVGETRARVWRLYMAASAVGFEDGGLGLHQVLGVVPDADGNSGMPRTRDVWSASSTGPKA